MGKKKSGKKSSKVNSSVNPTTPQKKKTFPDEFPFWARLKIDKKRTTLVIDEEVEIKIPSQKVEELFVHREATHTKGKNVKEISPNPDPSDPDPMYLKRPRKLPKKLFEPHNKDLNMPEELRKLYEKNNHKDK